MLRGISRVTLFYMGANHILRLKKDATLVLPSLLVTLAIACAATAQTAQTAPAALTTDEQVSITRDPTNPYGILLNAPGEVLATYDGGKVTIPDITDRLKDRFFRHTTGLHFPKFTSPCQKEPNGIECIEGSTQRVAALRIMLMMAREMGLEKKPDYIYMAKIARQKALADALMDAMREEAHSLVIPEDELHAAYEREKGAIIQTHAKAIEAQRIVVSSEKHKGKAAWRAAEALRLIKAGHPFEEIAKEFSDKPEAVNVQMYDLSFFESNAGGTGNKVAGLLVVPEGQVSDVLTCDEGYELVKVVRIVTDPNFSQDMAMDIIRDSFREEESEKRINDLLEQSQKAYNMLEGDALAKAKGKTVSPTTRPVKDQGPKATQEDLSRIVESLGADAKEEDVDKLITAQNQGTGLKDLQDLAERIKNKQPLDADKEEAVFECGSFALTRQDLELLSNWRGAEVTDLTAQYKTNDIWLRQLYLGEWAKVLGYDKQSEVQHRVQWELAITLTREVRQRLMEQYRKESTFEEEKILKVYDDEFTATFSAKIEYDVLVVTAPYDGDQDRYTAAKARAEEQAKGLIARIKAGTTSFDSVAQAGQGLQYLQSQQRDLDESHPMFESASKAGPGEVLAQPYEDFGGFCVVRITSFQPRQKMPYDIAKTYIIEDFRNAAHGELDKNLESILLKKRNFVFDREVARKIQR